MSLPISARTASLGTARSSNSSGDSSEQTADNSRSSQPSQTTGSSSDRLNERGASTRESTNPADGSLPGRGRSGFQPIEVPGGPSETTSNASENNTNENSEAGNASESSNRPGESNDAESPSGEDLSRREQHKVEKLERKDQKVRKHEQAHLSTGGRYVRGGLDLNYKRGPDGERYAVGGSVSLDTSGERSPQKTIQKMRQVRAAALAPAQPSPKDLQVAQSAMKKASKARQELSEEQQEEVQDTREKIEQETSSDSEQQGVGRTSNRGNDRRITASERSGAGETGEGNESAENRRPARSAEPPSHASFREPGEGLNTPDIEASPGTDGPEIKELNEISTDELEEREQVLAPDEAFDDAVGTAGKNTVTLGANFEATA